MLLGAKHKVQGKLLWFLVLLLLFRHIWLTQPMPLAAYAARTLFMKLTAAVEVDSRLTDNNYYTDWPKCGAIATVQKCKLNKHISLPLWPTVMQLCSHMHVLMVNKYASRTYDFRRPDLRPSWIWLKTLNCLRISGFLTLTKILQPISSMDHYLQSVLKISL